jgi:putative DNA primase/helicase
MTQENYGTDATVSKKQARQYTYFQNIKRSHGERRDFDPVELLSRLCQNPLHVEAKETAPLWTFRTFTGDKRGNDNLESFSALCFDFDKGGVTPEDWAFELPDTAYFWHTTLSHTPEHPKYRLIVPLSEPVPGKYCKQLHVNFLRSIGAEKEHDSVTLDGARIYYMPAVTPTSREHYKFGIHGGAVLSPADLGVEQPIDPGQQQARQDAEQWIMEGSPRTTVALELPDHAAYEVAPHEAQLGAGERNVGLFKAVVDLVANGIPAAVIWNYLVDANRTRVSPMLKEQELRAILQSAQKFIARQNEQRAESAARLMASSQAEALKPGVVTGTPAAEEVQLRARKRSKEHKIVERMVYLLGGIENCIYDGLDLYVYDETQGRWVVRTMTYFERLLDSNLSGLYTLELIKKLYNVCCIKAYRPHFAFNVGARAIPFKNCTVRFDESTKTMIPGPHRREDYLTIQLPHDYIENAQTPEFDKFLDSIFSYNPATFDPSVASEQKILELHEDKADIIRALWEAIGYTLTADTSIEVSFWFLGTTGANGKSTLCKVIREVVGPANSSAAQIEQLTARFGLSLIQDKLFFVASEISTEEQLKDGSLKALISGEPVMMERKGKDCKQYIPIVKFWFLFNNFPHLRDYSEAFPRRVAIWEFVNTFKGANRDINLFRKLSAEAGAIASRSVAYAGQLLARGEFKPSAVMERVKDEWRGVNDIVQAYIDERIVVEQDAMGFFISRQELYDDFINYCKRTNSSARPLKDERFFSRFSARVPVAGDGKYRPRAGNAPNRPRGFTNVRFNGFQSSGFST